MLGQKVRLSKQGKVKEMAKGYSYDLRQKVIQAIELDGLRKSEAATIFQIS